MNLRIHECSNSTSHFYSAHDLNHDYHSDSINNISHNFHTVLTIDRVNGFADIRQLHLVRS